MCNRNQYYISICLTEIEILIITGVTDIRI